MSQTAGEPDSPFLGARVDRNSRRRTTTAYPSALDFPVPLMGIDDVPEVVYQRRSMRIEGESLPLAPYAFADRFETVLVMQERSQLARPREEETQIP